MSCKKVDYASNVGKLPPFKSRGPETLRQEYRLSSEWLTHSACHAKPFVFCVLLSMQVQKFSHGG
jgi:hypothetical protein